MKYRINVEDRVHALAKFENAIERLKYHKETGNWDYPMEYYKSNGVIEIKNEEVRN
jgi:hypothetical protein